MKIKKKGILSLGVISFMFGLGLQSFNHVYANSLPNVPSLAEKLSVITKGVTPLNQLQNEYIFRRDFIDLVGERYRVLGTRTNLLVIVNSQITETQLRRLLQLVTTTTVIPGAITRLGQAPPTIITTTTQNVIRIRVVTATNETRRITVLVGNDGILGGASSNTLNFPLNFNGTVLNAAQFRQALDQLFDTGNWRIIINRN